MDYKNKYIKYKLKYLQFKNKNKNKIIKGGLVGFEKGTDKWIPLNKQKYAINEAKLFNKLKIIAKKDDRQKYQSDKEIVKKNYYEKIIKDIILESIKLLDEEEKKICYRLIARIHQSRAKKAPTELNHKHVSELWTDIFNKIPNELKKTPEIKKLEFHKEKKPPELKLTEPEYPIETVASKETTTMSLKESNAMPSEKFRTMSLEESSAMPSEKFSTMSLEESVITPLEEKGKSSEVSFEKPKVGKEILNKIQHIEQILKIMGEDEHSYEDSNKYKSFTNKQLKAFYNFLKKELMYANTIMSLLLDIENYDHITKQNDINTLIDHYTIGKQAIIEIIKNNLSDEYIKDNEDRLNLDSVSDMIQVLILVKFPDAGNHLKETYPTMEDIYDVYSTFNEYN